MGEMQYWIDAMAKDLIANSRRNNEWRMPTIKEFIL
jgi:hypothetical protein